MGAERDRLSIHHQLKGNWKHWGPYLSERAWGTVREDYSENGDAWRYFPHDQAISRAYRWNEDGLAGISDRFQYLCFAFAFWNGQDPILKERFFGLNPYEGNHGEDGKEYYFYLDNTPTHSYMKMLYKYPQQAFPYEKLIIENQKRGPHDPEYELVDTGIFDDQRYFDIFIEYAKADEDDILIQLTAINRGAESAPLYMLPTLWFRNTWSWGYEHAPKPSLFQAYQHIEAHHPNMKTYFLYSDQSADWMFTENETNFEKLFQTSNASPYVKDAFHRFLIHDEKTAINEQKTGTKSAGLIHANIEPGKPFTLRLRLTTTSHAHPFKNFATLFKERQQEADEFYDALVNSKHLTAEERMIQRQAFAGLLWSKQLYHYDIEEWLTGDPAYPPVQRNHPRNADWVNLTNFDVISMPDKWEYPWYATWDLGFHCIPYALIDADFAKRQLLLMTREWYMHPNGQLPAYEWNFGDVNPPVHAWAAYRVYKIDAKLSGKPDRAFLEGIFHKLLLNFTWWVNRRDKLGNNVFQGGFLGLDNISIFDRSDEINLQGRIDQADGTAWMGFYCILMMKIALELSVEDPIYQDSATKFFEHFLRIASAMIDPGRKGYSLWDEQDGFFYDVLHFDHQTIPLRIRSLVGLLPLFAVETIEPSLLKNAPVFERRMEWFLSQRPNYTSTMSCVEDPGVGSRRLMAVLTRDRLVKVLQYMLDENEFLSEYGIRSLSKYHEKHPYHLDLGDKSYHIQYEPGEACFRHMAGGNSNWRGPIWFPLNFLIIESLQKFYHYYGEELKVEFPTGSGRLMHLGDVAKEISKRLSSLFIKSEKGRPIYAEDSFFNRDPHWQNLILFNEFFHGDTGIGLGANHQTGWTALIAKLLQQCGGEA